MITYVTNLFKSLLNIIEKIPLDVTLIIINIIVFIFSYRRYAYVGKYRNKGYQLENEYASLLKTRILFIAVIPIIMIYLKIIILSIGLNKLDFDIIIMMILSLWFFGNDIKKSKEYNDFPSRGLLVKLEYILYVFVVPISIMVINLIILLFLHDTSSRVIYKIFEQNHTSTDYYINMIALYTIAYIFNLLPNMIFYIFNKIQLRRRVKEVKVFYNQNGELKVTYNIDYKDFDVSKEFITFYSRAERCRSVIPTEELVKIQYYYYN